MALLVWETLAELSAEERVLVVEDAELKDKEGAKKYEVSENTFLERRRVAQMKARRLLQKKVVAAAKKTGVKETELRELGLDGFLAGDRKVTRDDIINHLVSNSIMVEQTVLGGG